MRLIDVIMTVDELGDDGVIYAQEPWTEQSEALVLTGPVADDMAVVHRGDAYVYFLEVGIAKEFLEGWIARLHPPPPIDEQCRRVIEYAINDA